MCCCPNWRCVHVVWGPHADVHVKVTAFSKDVGGHETLTIKSAQPVTVNRIGRSGFKRLGFKIKDQHVSKRDGAVHQGHGQHRIHAVFDDEFLPPTCQENDERCKSKNSDKFDSDVPDLCGT